MLTDNDSAELEALFDSIALPSPRKSVPPLPAEAGAAASSGEVYSRVGQLTRQLYDTLRQLGYDGSLQAVVQKDIPDTRERLAYIANLSEQAATRTLNALEKIRPLQDSLEDQARMLDRRWALLYANRLDVGEFRQLAGDTHEFMREIPQRARKSHAHLHEIMMAQEFQDLTGQVINKVVALAQKMEQEMLQLLVTAIPAEIRVGGAGDLLDGPVIDPARRDDVAATQEQVDRLLESLGF